CALPRPSGPAAAPASARVLSSALWAHLPALLPDAGALDPRAPGDPRPGAVLVDAPRAVCHASRLCPYVAREHLLRHCPGVLVVGPAGAVLPRVSLAPARVYAARPGPCLSPRLPAPVDRLGWSGQRRGPPSWQSSGPRELSILFQPSSPVARVCPGH